MKRQLTSIMLFSALLVGGASTFVSCTDNESDSAYNTSISLADAIAKEKQALIDITNTLETKADHAADKEALERRIQDNKDLIDGVDSKFTTAFGQYASLDAAVSASKAYTDEKIESAKDELNTAIEQLGQTDEVARQQLETSLLEKITANGEAIANEADARQQLEDNYDMAFDFLINKNLNNIAINATQNPVLGYYNAAFIGSQLNLAASFYGTATQANQDWDIKAGLLNNENAGEIYVSLNPTEIDPACITSLKLVDSQGNEAKGFELGQLENTDRVLTYGVTKAVASVSSNGFYAIPVKAVAPANDDFSLNKGELKEAAKNVLAKLQNPKETNLNLSQIGTALYSSVNNQLKAYTVKAEYYLWNPETKKFVKKTQVAPTYNVAAFAVKPLSFNTLKDNETLKKVGVALDKYMIPTLSDKLGKIMSALDVNIELSKDNQTINVYTIVALTDVTAAKDENGSVWFYKNGAKIEGSEIKNADIETITTTDVEGHAQNVYKITTTDNTIANVVADLNNQLGDQLQPVKDAISNAADKWDNAITPVNNLLHKINAHISDVNQLLQPTMLYKSTKTNSWNTLSTLKGKLGTRMTGTGSTVLVATSWTGELLAPAYKKSVYVKEAGANVTLMDGTTSAKTPFDGSVQKVLFTASAKGNYTVVYKAVDYSGVETTKEFYITVE